MPSPFAHAAAGFIVYRFSRSDRANKLRLTRPPRLLLLTLTLSLLPDIDAVPGVLLNQMAAFHNNGTHSLLLAALISFVVGMSARRSPLLGFWRWFFIAFAAYGSHILMDFFTIGGRGIMLFWPLTSQRFMPDVQFFVGVRWSEGLFSVHHLVTLGSEFIFVLVMLLMVALWERLRLARTNKQQEQKGG